MLKLRILMLVKYIHSFFFRSARIENLVCELHDILLLDSYERRKSESKNPLIWKACKFFSQSDEDGITLEILRRIGIHAGSFCEFGVGDGLENNTLILLAEGWKGVWIGNDNLKFNPAVDGSRLSYEKVWVTKENIVDLTLSSLRNVDVELFDVISMDLDGNDLIFVSKLLEAGIHPAVFIVEYNSHFPPPIRFVVDYDDSHVYMGDDYFGASLQSYVDLFSQYGFRLVCCNLMTGSNAFFVHDRFREQFLDIPLDVKSLYCPPYFFLPKKFGYRHAVKTIEKLIRSG